MNRTLVGSVNDISYAAFKNVCKDYKDTTCGYSFDSRYARLDMFQTVEIRDELAAATASLRVHHYGVLNVYNTHELVENWTVTTAPTVFKAMRTLLGNDRKRNMVFVGVGFYFYNTSTAWHDLEYIAESLAGPEVDLVVPLSTVLTMPQTSECVALPVNAYRSRQTITPTLASVPKVLSRDLN
ncbi:uncharacterized protein LOC142765954 [Rhipicephalus microplus]|uniref:uncharacterized protein LOC142765954 n=1 Tax=Rhipicephalus microplus TaxID=6941 RepID=UPI003F6C4C54